MIDDETVTAITKAVPSFDLHVAMKRAVEQTVQKMLTVDQSYAVVASVDLTGTIHLGVAVRAGDHVEIRGELAGHLTTREFSGRVDIVITG